MTGRRLRDVFKDMFDEEKRLDAEIAKLEREKVLADKRRRRDALKRELSSDPSARVR